MTGFGYERFCTSCSKSVTDFTQLTDQQVIEVIRKTDGRICGRLTESQLQKEFLAVDRRANRSILPRFLGGLLLFGAVDTVNASESKPVIETVDHFQQNKDGQVLESNPTEKPIDDPQNVVKGKIVDTEDDSPVNFALIRLKNSDVKSNTDANGFFELIVPDSLLKREIVLEIRAVGYAPEEFTIKTADLAQMMDFQLTRKVYVLTGDVVIIKRRWWQFWRRR